MSLLRASLIALSLLACSSAFFAIAADLDPLLDPVPELDVVEAGITLVPPREERPVGALSGREEAPRGGVAVFLYTIIGQSRRARFTRVELVSGRAIRAAGGRILIDTP